MAVRHGEIANTMGGVGNIRKQARQLLQLQEINGLAELVGTTPFGLELLTARANYNEFRVPKAAGGYRVIEAPRKALKKVLRRLNDHLQAVYWLERSEAAHGFVRWPEEVSGARNIVTNARAHLGAHGLLNVDLDDFFHQVTNDRVMEVFRRKPFCWPKDLLELVTELVTLHGRLPMGSPTSPVISNFAMRAADARLGTWAKANGFRYTRFVDDLTFSGTSGKTLDGPDVRCAVEEQLHDLGWRPDQQKVKHFGPGEVMVVTGLELGPQDVRLPAAFHAALDADLKRLSGAYRAYHLAGDGREGRWLKRFRQVVEGRLRFLQMVHGENDARNQRVRNRFEQAIRPPEREEVMSWLDFQNYG